MPTSHIDPSAARAFAVEVVKELRYQGYESLWAGGCVRDQLLNRVPTDYDVATSAPPDSVRKIFGHRRTIAVGAHLGSSQSLVQKHLEMSRLRLIVLTLSTLMDVIL